MPCHLHGNQGIFPPQTTRSDRTTCKSKSDADEATDGADGAAAADGAGEAADGVDDRTRTREGGGEERGMEKRVWGGAVGRTVVGGPWILCGFWVADGSGLRLRK